MLRYVVLIHSDPNNMNSIVYHLMILRYSMESLHWYFPWATALHSYNMADRGEKLQQLHYYHPFSDSLDIYLTINHYENYPPKMVPIAEIWGSGSWTVFQILRQPRGARAGPAKGVVRHSYGHIRDIDTTRICKNPTGASVVAVRGPRTGCSRDI